jgi:adenine/guanine phosphoribosyltransferase-like PRPP-binding protein
MLMQSQRRPNPYIHDDVLATGGTKAVCELVEQLGQLYNAILNRITFKRAANQWKDILRQLHINSMRTVT